MTPQGWSLRLYSTQAIAIQDCNCIREQEGQRLGTWSPCRSSALARVAQTTLSHSGKRPPALPAGNPPIGAHAESRDLRHSADRFS